MSTSYPMNARTIETLVPVYSIACADAMAEYLAKKEQRGDPASALEEGAKLKDCIYKAAAKLEGTPCAETYQAYRDCLSRTDRGGRVPCKAIKARLEECAAKHVGKLD